MLVKHPYDNPYLGYDIFENLVDPLGSLVESFLCLFDFGGKVFQILVRFSKIFLEFFNVRFGLLNLRLDLLFRLFVANQCFVLGSDDVIKIIQPCLGCSELLFLKLHPTMVQTTNPDV